MEPRLPEGVHALTDRQREVAELVAQGLTNAEIGDRLGISRDGAKYHVSEVLTRLNLERREQIGEWVRGQAMGKRRFALALVGVAAVLVAAVVLVALVAMDSDDDGLPSADDALPPSNIEVDESPVPTATVEPPSIADPEPAESLYQPVAWDHPTRVNRSPPSSLDEAIKERVVHADGWQFEGEPPAAFDPGAKDGEVCPSVPAEGRAQSGDWVLHAGSPTGPGAPSVAGQQRLVLFPIAPELLLDIAEPQLLRIRAVDTANWEATHLVESMRRPARTASESWAYEFVFESPRDTRWLAVVTAGPLWGCFTLHIGYDPVRWPAPGDVSSHWFAGPSANDDGEDAALRDYTTFEGLLSGSASRSCVPLMTAGLGPRVRSGEFGLAYLGGFGNDLNDGYSPTKRGAKVIWLAQYQIDLGDFILRATLSTDRTAGAAVSPSEPVHTYQFVAPGPSSATLEVFGFVTSPVLPREGTWTMVATAAPSNWGCFVLTVGTAELIAQPSGS